MKILLVIDHFGSGGAQRQMVELACALKERGHSVEFFIYFPQHDFFETRINDSQIPVHKYTKEKGFSFGVVATLSSLMRTGHFDIVLSFLDSPNFYAEIAGLISRGPKLIVSERTSHINDKSLVTAGLRRFMHVFSNQIVANSHSHADWLKGKMFLKNKVSPIYNGLDLDSFTPALPTTDKRDGLRLLAIGTVAPIKNLINIIQALQVFYNEHGYVPEVDWAGKRDSSLAGQLYCKQVDELLESLPEVRKRWHWLGEKSDISQLLNQYHALIHPSLYEGLPNAVCEALACGKPVLISNVCDHPMLVSDGERGFLFDPTEPASIAEAIKKMINLNADERLKFSRNAREYAETNLGIDKMVEAYETLFKQLLEQRSNKTIVVN